MREEKIENNCYIVDRCPVIILEGNVSFNGTTLSHDVPLYFSAGKSLKCKGYCHILSY